MYDHLQKFGIQTIYGKELSRSQEAGIAEPGLSFWHVTSVVTQGSMLRRSLCLV